MEGGDELLTSIHSSLSHLPLPPSRLPPYSIWLFQINSSEFSLRSYTHRLATLYRLPIRPLFVFDGPERPDVKRGKQVVKDGQEGMDNERAFRGMIEAYGFDSWDVSNTSSTKTKRC